VSRKPIVVPVRLSDVQRARLNGFSPLEAGDAAKANSDHFQILVRETDGRREIQIHCPTFLRGPLGFNLAPGGISY